MTRSMQRLIKEKKEERAKLIQLANPRSRKRISEAEAIQILKRHIPYISYAGTSNEIEKFEIKSYNKNSIQKSARFIVYTKDERIFEISVYQSLRPQSKEEKEADRTATFPSGLFGIYHDQIEV